jgi:hypothetical protein
MELKASSSKRRILDVQIIRERPFVSSGGRENGPASIYVWSGSGVPMHFRRGPVYFQEIQKRCCSLKLAQICTKLQSQIKV